MARDYRSAEVFSPGTRPLPLWLWLFAALAIGGFVFLIYYLDQYEKSKTDLPATQQSEQSAQVSPGSNDSKSDEGNAAKEGGTSFSFYKLLPKISVDVAKNKTEQNSQPATTRQQPVDPGFKYVLQVGSFRDYKEADRLKARLAFVGLEANIEKVTLNASDTWHRVRIGPIQSEREMNKIRGQLRKQQIEPIMLKVKG